MVIQGSFNPAHIVRLFLAYEYAFEMSYAGKIVRIAHAKGGWYAAKLDNKGTLLDYFIIYDFYSGFEAHNELTHGLIEKIKDIHIVETLQGNTRDDDARYIEDVLSIWAGRFDTIEKITVLQAGRNALVDDKTGEFIFSPRPTEFKK